MKTRIDFKRLVLRSGIFKINTEREYAEGVYRLRADKNISSKLIESPVQIRYFEGSLTTVLFNYFRKTPQQTLKDAVEEEITEIGEGMSKILSDSLYFTADEIKGYLKKVIRQRSFKNRIEERLKATGAFEITKGDRRYFKKYVPLYQEIQKYLSTNETDTYYYIAHLLIGCRIEDGDLKTVFNRIRKYFSRHEGKPDSDIAIYRKTPSRFIDIP